MNHLKFDPVLKVPQFHPCGEILVVLEAEAVDMIEKTLHTGSLSDGKIFILPVEEGLPGPYRRARQAGPLMKDQPHCVQISLILQAKSYLGLVNRCLRENCR